jgi:hypothetical protein
VDIETFSCAARLWCRRRKRNPKMAKTMRARPPITPPTIAPTGVELLSVAEVPETPLPGVEEVASELEVTDAVVDDSVPF